MPEVGRRDGRNDITRQKVENNEIVRRWRTFLHNPYETNGPGKNSAIKTRGFLHYIVTAIDSVLTKGTERKTLVARGEKGPETIDRARGIDGEGKRDRESEGGRERKREDVRPGRVVRVGSMRFFFLTKARRKKKTGISDRVRDPLACEESVMLF